MPQGRDSLFKMAGWGAFRLKSQQPACSAAWAVCTGQAWPAPCELVSSPPSCVRVFVLAILVLTKKIRGKSQPETHVDNARSDLGVEKVQCRQNGAYSGTWGRRTVWSQKLEASLGMTARLCFKPNQRTKGHLVRLSLGLVNTKTWVG